MKPLFKSLAVAAHEDHLKEIKIFIALQYGFDIDEYCLLRNIEKHKELNDFNLIILATSEVSGTLINKLNGFKGQIFFLLVDSNAVNINPNNFFLYTIRPAQYDTFIKQLILAQAVEESSKGVMAKLHNKRLKIYDSHGHRNINLKEILRLNASGAYTKIHTINKIFANQSHNLNHYTDKLSDDFFRISKSYIINADYIKDYSTKSSPFIIMTDNFKIKVSRNYRLTLEDIISKMKLCIFISFSFLS